MTGAWSLNEIEAWARKAARGAVCDWGLAQEAGRAVRWLATRMLPGGEACASLLDWRAGGGTGPVCPVMAGAMLCDGVLGTGAEPLRIEGMIAPLLLLPFVARVAETRGGTVTLAWPGVQFNCAPDGSLSQADPVSSPTRADVEVRFGGELAARAVAVGHWADVDASTIASLSACAQRTYAPATEQSRKTGAGAGETDND